MHTAVFKTDNQGLVHWDDPEGWYGEGYTHVNIYTINMHKDMLIFVGKITKPPF